MFTSPLGSSGRSLEVFLDLLGLLAFFLTLPPPIGGRELEVAVAEVGGARVGDDDLEGLLLALPVREVSG